MANLVKSFYLVIEGKKPRWGGKINDFGVKILREKPALNSDEIAVLLKMEVPQEFFERMIPVAELKLPKDTILTLDQATIVSLVAPELSEKLKISLQDAEDGLQLMLKQKEHPLQTIQE